ncbi:hypothetical protein L810_2335 [Burkholderia sp. AU4i]|nr:hypothetical protein L810_2335 [Burkholderia sp. AU4i]
MRAERLGAAEPIAPDKCKRRERRACARSIRVDSPRPPASRSEFSHCPRYSTVVRESSNESLFYTRSRGHPAGTLLSHRIADASVARHSLIGWPSRSGRFISAHLPRQHVGFPVKPRAAARPETAWRCAGPPNPPGVDA